MSSKYGGYMGKVLKINLTQEKVEDYPWTDKDRELYLGGKIMAAKILYDNIESGVEPLSEENYLIISTGPITGSGAPMSSRFNISTVSPLTGYIASSNCGGNFGLSLKKAGYDALIITGKAAKPIWIELIEEQVIFHDADSIWGMTTGETQEALGKDGGKIVIGPAGENLVKYAGIFSEERAAGRAGVGAVMGFKNLKAIVAKGSKKTESKNPEKAKKIFRSWIKLLKNHPLTGEQLPKLGTAGLVSGMNAHNILATRNYKYGKFDDFEMVSGEYLAEKYLIKNKGCVTCPIQCGRIVKVQGKEVKGPELETIGLLGPNIENNNLELILEWNLLLDQLGMDTISTGSTIGFAMELNERGLWDNGLQFGKVENLSKVFEDIAYRRGIGDLLAEGTKVLSKKFGGEDFAINSKGLELAAYEPRSAVGQGLGYAVANRGGCHLNAGYLVLFEGLGLNVDPYTAKSKAALTTLSQNLMEAVSAGGNCLFSLYAMIPGGLIRRPYSIITRIVNKTIPHFGGMINIINKTGEKALPIHLPMIPHTKALKAVTGMKMDFGRLKVIGERGYNIERMFNLRRGLTKEDDNLPKRLTSELKEKQNPRSKVPLETLKDDYYRARGWSKDGVPIERILKRVRLQEDV
ncbi:MAG: aldehyde:ferredoxin oxidoreductase [Gottschalkiaceae bacterium]|nr:MAG: aldehyde:ferredoxin oxidoreductase [Gottschalkiaceae bacterium]